MPFENIPLVSVAKQNNSRAQLNPNRWDST